MLQITMLFPAPDATADRQRSNTLHSQRSAKQRAQKTYAIGHETIFPGGQIFGRNAGKRPPASRGPPHFD